MGIARPPGVTGLDFAGKLSRGYCSTARRHRAGFCWEALAGLSQPGGRAVWCLNTILDVVLKASLDANLDAILKTVLETIYTSI